MYRYSVDNAVTYTSEDFVLFRESPFACWMERLTLENPDHGIPPDVDSQAPHNSMERQDEVADTLCAEGRDVFLVDWEADESRRRSATLEAMRSGVDFIVNGQVALGPLSGSANLLMRTSGFSDLGEFLYVPCNTQSKTTMHSAFRLCFLADLLHSLQGQLPPQMLIIRGGTDVMPLNTEDHIYHYRAVKQRFMETMRSFRKHRMPDPAESSHFGRWSDCAHEVLKQRALREDVDGPSPEVTEEQQDMPLLAVAGDAVAREVEPAATQRAPDELPLPIMADAAARRAGDSQVAKDPMPTLAEQAVMLDRSALAQVGVTAAPGHTPNLARAMAAAPVTSGRRLADAMAPAGETEPAPGLFDVALQNLEFIGSSIRGHSIGENDSEPQPHIAEKTLPLEPVPETLDPALPEAAYQFPDQGESLSWPEPPPPLLSDLTPDTALHTSTPLELVEELPVELPATRDKPHPLDSSDHSRTSVSVVDLDSAPAASPESLPASAGTSFGWQALDDQTEEPDFLLEPAGVNEGDEDEDEPSFSNSLITNKDYSL